MHQEIYTIKKEQLRVLSQSLIFMLSPLVAPSILSLVLILLSFFSVEWLHKFSIPLIFSMVLIAIPATFTGLLISMIRKIIIFSNQKVNTVLWVLLALILSVITSMKFMSWISLQFVGISGVMGILSALIACIMISYMESLASFNQ